MPVGLDSFTNAIAVYGVDINGNAAPSLSVNDLRSATGTKSAVASATGSTTILLANAARKGATITNTDANALYLDLSGGTASSTNFSVSIAANGYYEVPFGYAGLITGAWAADGSGSALVTEFV